MVMNVKTGHSIATDALEAAHDLYNQIGQDNISFCLFFCSPDYDLEVLGKTLHSLFKGAPLIGCTTAGEIGPKGMQQGSIVGVSIQSNKFIVATDLLNNLSSFNVQDGVRSSIVLKQTLREQGVEFNNNNSFFLTLVDGLSRKEEVILAALNASASNIPLAGGSAADGTNFKSTAIYYRGKFHNNAALITLIHTDHPFIVFKENAYEESGDQIVITEINDESGLIEEFNGEPAADAYAKIIGYSVNNLDFATTSNNPLALKYGRELYVRTVTFSEDTGKGAAFPYSSNIEEGMILKVTKPIDTQASISKKLLDIKKSIGDISVIFGFDCLCRQFIYRQHKNYDEMSEIMKQNNVIGFHTYGEQYQRSHANQTFTGIAIGK
jgi:hypothetical protein